MSMYVSTAVVYLGVYVHIYNCLGVYVYIYVYL